jgi:hypothetical protein
VSKTANRTRPRLPPLTCLRRLGQDLEPPGLRRPPQPLDGGGFGYTAFGIDAFAGLIAGWECSLSKETAFVERSI